MAEAEFASRIHHGDELFHGGLDSDGGYVPPRSKHRLAAIDAWTKTLAAKGEPTTVMSVDQVWSDFFPNVEQTKILLRHGARDAMTRILTLIGITEGFGNTGMAALPVLEMQTYFKESIDGTCLAHLYKGMFEAHGNDEAGRGAEKGHEDMWYAIRDEALDNPPVTPDMYEDLPISPPPGYEGPAKPSPDAVGPAAVGVQLFEQLDPMIEIVLTAMAQILVIELQAYAAFAWAQEVLSDPACSSAPEFSTKTVDYIQTDENIHVGYLQCALAEARSMTMLGTSGEEVPGREVIDAICKKVIGVHTGDRLTRIRNFRMRQIENELESRADGSDVLAEFMAADTNAWAGEQAEA